MLENKTKQEIQCLLPYGMNKKVLSVISHIQKFRNRSYCDNLFC